MPFEENTGINSINLGDGRAIDIAGKVIEEEVEVSPTSRASKVIMIRSNTIEIGD